MSNKSVGIKILAIIGTVLVWFPIAATIITGLPRSIQSGEFLIDYLMPAELGLVFFVGAAILILAAVKSNVLRKPIIWCLVGAVILLIGSQAVAVVTGLATGEHDAVGWRWILVLSLLGGYTLAVILEGVFGVQLIRHLFLPEPNNNTPSTIANG